jgi:hypothetical protein
LPLAASQVDITRPFTANELLYRRVSKEEIGPNGEVDPSRIQSISFKADVQTAPSVMRSAFSEPHDVLHFLCAGRDTSGWSVYSATVGSLPQGLKAGDGREFRFFPAHLPEEKCGAHSVVACCRQSDISRTYEKPTKTVIWEFKVKFATSLLSVPISEKIRGLEGESWLLRVWKRLVRRFGSSYNAR